MQDVPHPDGHGWQIVDGKLALKWTEGDLMPQVLTDVLVEEPDLHDLDQMDDDEVENLLDVIFDSDDDRDDD